MTLSLIKDSSVSLSLYVCVRKSESERMQHEVPRSWTDFNLRSIFSPGIVHSAMEDRLLSHVNDASEYSTCTFIYYVTGLRITESLFRRGTHTVFTCTFVVHHDRCKPVQIARTRKRYIHKNSTKCDRAHAVL